MRSHRLDIKKSPILNTWINIVYASLCIHYTSFIVCMLFSIDYFYRYSTYFNCTLPFGIIIAILIFIADTLFKYCENRFDKKFAEFIFYNSLSHLIIFIAFCSVLYTNLSSYNLHKPFLISMTFITLPTSIITAVNKFLVFNLFNL